MTSKDKDRTYYFQSTTLDLIAFAKEKGRSELEIAMGERLADFTDNGYDDYDDYEYDAQDELKIKSNEKEDKSL